MLLPGSPPPERAATPESTAFRDWFAQRGHTEVPFRGILPATLTTPGAVASWGAAHAAHGRLPLARCLQSAVDYARDGFPVTERLAGWIAATRTELAAHAHTAAIFLPGGAVPRAGSLLRNPDLARTLQAVATDGPAGFYGGAVGAELARFSAAQGGFFTQADLSAQDARWGTPIHGTYRDVTLYETPAPTQGFTVLQMLMIRARPVAHFVLGTISVFFLGVVIFVIIALDAPLYGPEGLPPEPYLELWSQQMAWDEPRP
jgi:gamma-glutamyltranspeptidase/glutathione hydrolase